jgi:hypothetical protein
VKRTDSGSVLGQIASPLQSHFCHLADVLRIHSASRSTSTVVPRRGTDVTVLVDSRCVGSENRLPNPAQLHSVAKLEVDMLGDFRDGVVVRVGKDSRIRLRRRRIRRRGCQFEDHECGNPGKCQPEYTDGSKLFKLTCAGECLGPLRRSWRSV